MAQATEGREGVLDLEALMATGAIAGVDIAPDGSAVTFSSSFNGVPQIYVLPIGGGEPRQITDGEKSTMPKWSPAGDQIAFLRDVGGDENYAVCVISPQGGEIRDITGRPGKLHENHSWSRDGRRVTYVSNRDGQFDVYYSDVATGEVVRVTDHPTVHHAPEFSPDGTAISFASNRTDLRSNWDTFIVSLADGRERKMTEHEGEADEMSYYAGQSPFWSPDGQRILVASSVRGNYDIMAIDVQTLGREWLVDSAWDESNAKWSPDGTRLAYVVNEDGNLVLYVKNLVDGRTWTVSHTQGVSGYKGMRGFGGDYAWTPDGRHIVYSYLGPTEAGSVWIVPAEGGESRCLYSAMSSDIDRTLLVQPELVRYRSFDGTEISAFLYRPANSAGPVTAIVTPHGGPTGQTMNTWSPIIQYLVSRGYAVMAPNFRGSTGYGRDFQWANRNDWGGGDLRDVVEAANWLESEGVARRIGIMGGSYGGFMTLSAVTKYPERWDAAVSNYGIANLVTMYNTAREDMKQFQARNIGTPDENPDFYRDRSPLNFVDRITCPLLILQGERDPRVRLDEAHQIRDRLEATGKTYDLVVYEHEGHGWSKRENRIDSARRIAGFFDRYLAQ